MVWNEDEEFWSARLITDPEIAMRLLKELLDHGDIQITRYCIACFEPYRMQPMGEGMGISFEEAIAETYHDIFVKKIK